MAATAAAGLGVLAAFALPGGNNRVPASVTRPTSSTSNAPVATESTSTTTELASPAEDSSVPTQHDRAKEKTRGHDDHKDGK
jgi:hypothetical protein